MIPYLTNKLNTKTPNSASEATNHPSQTYSRNAENREESWPPIDALESMGLRGAYGGHTAQAYKSLVPLHMVSHSPLRSGIALL